MRRGTVNDKKYFASFKMLMKRFYKTNQCLRIKVSLCKLKDQMTFGTNRGCDTDMNTFLARNARHRHDLGKCPSLAYMRNQKKRGFVSIENKAAASRSLTNNLWQSMS